jgi:hypothetical protein
MRGPTDVLGGIATLTVAPPVPLAGAAPSPEAVQVQDAADAVNAIDAVPPPAGAAIANG